MPRKNRVSPAQDRLLLWLHVHDGDAYGEWVNAYEHLRPGQLHLTTLERLESLGLVERRVDADLVWGVYVILPAGRERVDAMVARGALDPPFAMG